MLNIRIQTAPSKGIYPVRRRGSKEGFSLLMRMKLSAWQKIEINTNPSPIETVENPDDPISDVMAMPIKPEIKPSVLRRVTRSRKKITDNIIVINGAVPKISPALTPEVRSRPSAKNV